MKKTHIISTRSELQKIIHQYKSKKKIIGYVPTLGGLHEGHLKLIRLAKKNSDVVIVSIFLNPIQFNSKKDFLSYPINLSADKRKIKLEKINILYVPKLKEIFPEKKINKIKASNISKKLCGKYRKGHFDGVVTVLKELFDHIAPHKVFFGEKDFQQFKVVQDLIYNYKMNIRILTLPTIRDNKGLALSSRNKLLNSKQKAIASCLFKIIKKISKEIVKNPKKIKKIKEWGVKKLLDSGFDSVDYLEIYDENNFTNASEYKKNLRVFVAASLGQVRLIDNYSVN